MYISFPTIRTEYIGPLDASKHYIVGVSYDMSLDEVLAAIPNQDSSFHLCRCIDTASRVVCLSIAASHSFFFCINFSGLSAADTAFIDIVHKF